MKGRWYLAGPMTSYPSLNFPAFHAAAARLRAEGFTIINPAEINGGADEIAQTARMTPAEMAAHWQKCMRNDICELVHCTGIFMLPGWVGSKGASLEHHIAREMGLRIVYLDGLNAGLPG